MPSGIEICETQLLHLANKIKDVEVDHEIDNYLPAINSVLENLSKEELIKKMVSVEFNRFINYYKKTRDISNQSSGSERRDDRDGAPRENNNGGATRYFVNIGSRDNFDWMSLKDYLKETLDLGRDDVFKVDVKEGFSFFNTDPEHTDKVMEVLNNVQLEGRRINVEISKNDGGGRRDHNGRSSGGGGFGGGRSSAPRREGVLHQEEKVQAVVEATETQVQEKVDLVEEALLQEKEVLAEEVQLQEVKVLQTELQDALKVLVTHLDQEDQEETNIYC